jgi:hypothetical protein
MHMANEGSTKPTELEFELRYIADSPTEDHGGFHPRVVTAAKDALAELERVRGLLQRYEEVLQKIARTSTSTWARALAQSALYEAWKVGAESADIGKLEDLIAKITPENIHRGSAETGGEKADREMAYRMECFGCHVMLGYANPSGRGDSVKAFLFLCEKCADGAWPLSFEEPNFPRTSQNQTASSGVEGAHEGTNADKAEPEKLNNAQKCTDTVHVHTPPFPQKRPHIYIEPEALAESSLSSPPPRGFCIGSRCRGCAQCQ